MIILLIISMLLLAIGLMAAGHGVKNVRKIAFAKNWKPVLGRIVFSEVMTNSSGKDESFQVNIRYRYRVRNTQYLGSEPFFGSRQKIFRMRKLAEKWTDRYPIGQDIPVFVNLENHQESTLNRRFGDDHQTILVIGILLVGLGIAGMMTFIL